jgi:uncharacterized hydrophobic protein (TIGR00271 family)
MVPKVDESRRGEVQVQLRENSHPGFDYFLLVLLSSVIATLGLLIDSEATIIGAMLVAPLMSPIVGVGLGSIRGDEKLLRDAVAALIRGALMAIAMSAFLTVLNRVLPFIPFQVDNLPDEIMSRIRPSPFDMVIALAGGIAAAYALIMPNLSAALPGVAIATATMPPLCVVGVGLATNRGDVAGGGFLLFITNIVTIAFASMIVFWILGFNPQTRSKGEGWLNLPRTLWVTFFVTILILIPLTFFSIQFVREVGERRQIDTIVREELHKLQDAELMEWNNIGDEQIFRLELIIRTTDLLQYRDTVKLQEAIGSRLNGANLLAPNQEVQVLVQQILVARLDPQVPPTSTTTPTATLTATLGPSPTASSTPTQTLPPTNTPTNTQPPSPTASNTPLPTFTPTPSTGKVVMAYYPSIYLRQSPGGPIIADLKLGQELDLLYGRDIYRGLVWIEVRDQSGRVGWIPEFYILVLTPEPSSTASLIPSGTVLTPTP